MMNNTLVLWLTGLSGSGKTTIAVRFSELMGVEGKTCKIIDGDQIRSKQHKHLSFSRICIDENNKKIAQMCLELDGQYNFILVAVISPFKDTRFYNRELIGKKCFREVFIKASKDTVIKRDPKGLYKKALNGEINNFIGICPQTPYEAPEEAEIVLDTEALNVDQCAAQLVSFVNQSNMVKKA